MELVRESARQGLVRPLRAGERCHRDEAGVRSVDDARTSRRRRFDNPSVGPSHTPQGDVGRDLEDFRCHLEVVL